MKTPPEFNHADLARIRVLVGEWEPVTPGEWVQRRALLVKLGVKVEPLTDILIQCPRGGCRVPPGYPCWVARDPLDRRVKPFVHAERQVDAVTLLATLT